MGKTALDWKKYYSSQEFQEHFIYKGGDLGMTCTEEGTAFLLWSPSAQEVTLNLYENGREAPCFRREEMHRKEKGVWEYRTNEYLHGVYYDYEIEIEGKVYRSADPYARACGINGYRSMAVDLCRTNPRGWEQDRAPTEQEERIIYELHIKEFSWDPAGGFPEQYRGKFKAFCCTETTLEGTEDTTGICYLQRLGVTHIQLMPVYDYGSVNEEGEAKKEFNWGYDPVNYNVPEGSYSTNPADGEVRILEMKEMIQALHQNGFRVIMDVVYNHTYSLDSWLQRTAPWYYYRVHEDGTVSNGSACGNDIASEREMCGRYILESVLYWAKEYHIDGFRFHLMGLLEVKLMNRIRRALDNKYGIGEKLVFGEPWSADVTAMEGAAVPALKKNTGLLDKNVGIFCDNTRDAIKGSVFEPDEVGFVNGGDDMEEIITHCVTAWRGMKEGDIPNVKAPSQILNYVSAHDNQTLWDKLAESIPDETERMRANKMAAGIYMTCQGTLFLLSGEEFARTKGGLDNTYNSPVSVNRLDWKQIRKESGLVEYYKGLIGLRKLLPGLYDKSESAWKRILPVKKEKGIVVFLVNNRKPNKAGNWNTLMVVYNSRRDAQKIELGDMEWEVLADAESSLWWKHPFQVKKEIMAMPVSVLVLGCREEYAGLRQEELERRI